MGYPQFDIRERGPARLNSSEKEFEQKAREQKALEFESRHRPQNSSPLEPFVFNLLDVPLVSLIKDETEEE